MLRLYRVAPNVTTLGPGVRFCIWVQGCDRRCPGCMSSDTWDPNGGFDMEETELAEIMLKYPFEGVTISGGEPMRQCAGLSRLIDLLRQRRDVGVMVYTGAVLEQLKAMHDPDVDGFLSRIDLLVDGEYVQSLDDGGALRGSANQQAHCLTDRYRIAMAETFGQPGQRRQQLQIDEHGVLMIGLRADGSGSDGICHTEELVSGDEFDSFDAVLDSLSSNDKGGYH